MIKMERNDSQLWNRNDYRGKPLRRPTVTDQVTRHTQFRITFRQISQIDAVFPSWNEMKEKSWRIHTNKSSIQIEIEFPNVKIPRFQPEKSNKIFPPDITLTLSGTHFDMWNTWVQYRHVACHKKTPGKIDESSWHDWVSLRPVVCSRVPLRVGGNGNVLRHFRAFDCFFCFISRQLRVDS